MHITYHEGSRTFHLGTEDYSYIFKIMQNEQLGQLYFGASIRDRESFDHLLEMKHRPVTSYPFEGDRLFSPEHLKQEYPAYGAGDYRHPAIRILQGNGSHITDFRYRSHEVQCGKPPLPGLPATYCEVDDEAITLSVSMYDEHMSMELILRYTVFRDYPALARSACIRNNGGESVRLDTAMSLCLDLPDCDYEWLQLSGAWSRERMPVTRRLQPGIQSVESTRGHSSHTHNPFVMLQRQGADERTGEVLGFSLIYSGNFLAQAEVDTYGTTRLLMGINPFAFDWKLESGECFEVPEAVIVYSGSGLGGMSRAFHDLYGKRLARGFWRDRLRPILINNWEATYFDFDEDKILEIAGAAREAGIELFVLDDGWYGKRNNFTQSLGDWVANRDKLKNGVDGLAERLKAMDMQLGLWFEPEMLNPDSDLYRAHPDWVLQTPGRSRCNGRNQYVLDFSRKEVVDAVFCMMENILREGKVSYIKLDMNRSITECYSSALPVDRQGEVFHRYILGVYDLYDRLNRSFPELLIESCASGGGRFDPGLLYYAPQCWTSDNSDAIERLKIQYATSLCYPVASMGAHVSAVPNHQMNRHTPLHTRANVAFFGAFGYELDITALSGEERAVIREQIAFAKRYRPILQFGTFYRLRGPWDNDISAWMSVDQKKQTAVIGYYKILNEVNGPYHRIRLDGLAPDTLYCINGDKNRTHYGDELMRVGLLTTDNSSGEAIDGPMSQDFDSRLYILEAIQ